MTLWWSRWFCEFLSLSWSWSWIFSRDESFSLKLWNFSWKSSCLWTVLSSKPSRIMFVNRNQISLVSKEVPSSQTMYGLAKHIFDAPISSEIILRELLGTTLMLSLNLAESSHENRFHRFKTRRLPHSDKNSQRKAQSENTKWRTQSSRST